MDLYRIKLNNKYDFVQDCQPDKDGTWLCSADSKCFRRGFSYNVFHGKAERIEQVQDGKIMNSIQPTIDLVAEYLGYNDHKCFKKHKCLELPLVLYTFIYKMIAYDVFLRPQANDIKSESIGNYSYTKEDYQVGSLYYPAEIVSGLDAFKRVKFL